MKQTITSSQVRVHRTVEWMRAHGTWPDWLDFQDDALGAIQDMVGQFKAEEDELALLIAEVRRELEQPLDVVATDHDVDAEVAELLDRPSGDAAPSDPFGELAGGRVCTHQLMGRPTDEPAKGRLEGCDGCRPIGPEPEDEAPLVHDPPCGPPSGGAAG
jgi:hypothetical protein